MDKRPGQYGARVISFPLSILDLAAVAKGESIAESFAGSVRLAQSAERAGYKRVWYAEHHNISSIASSATAVLIAHIAANTGTIRVGAGGIMLPNHSPLQVAEQFGTLETLHPGRIDLGLGRAPGSDEPTARALRRNPTAAEHFPDDVVELQGLLGDESPLPGIRAIPGKGTHVPLYILGSSLFGAELAAMLGLPYAYASHFAPAALHDAIAIYRERFKPSAQLKTPYVIAGVGVKLAQAGSQGLVVLGRLRAVALRGAVLAGEPARPTLGEAEAVLQHADRLAPPGRAQKFPLAISFSARFSSSLSATRRFSWPFSRSSSFRRLTSAAFIPPYWLRQRCRVCSETSSAFAASPAVFPSESICSAVRSLRMICSGAVSLPLHLLRSSFAHCRGREGLSNRADRFPAALALGAPERGTGKTGFTLELRRGLGRDHEPDAAPWQMLRLPRHQDHPTARWAEWAGHRQAGARPPARSRSRRGSGSDWRIVDPPRSPSCCSATTRSHPVSLAVGV
jgi:luciferase family oxidoreductase group 1